MTDVNSIVRGVQGLMPLCEEGLRMLREIFASGSEEARGRLYVQVESYIKWRDTWQVDKFDSFAGASPNEAKRVLRYLAQLAQVMFDAKGLQKTYGLSVTNPPTQAAHGIADYRFSAHEDLDEANLNRFQDKCLSNLTFIRKCHFVLRKGDSDWRRLVSLLNNYVDKLRDFSPNREDASRPRRIEFDMNHMINEAKEDDLRQLIVAADAEAKDSNDTRRAGQYKELALAARFSKGLRFDEPTPVYHFKMEDFYITPAYDLAEKDKPIVGAGSTMALLFDYPVKRQKRVVMIEWILVFGNQNKDEEVQKLALMLATPKPRGMLLPRSYGVVQKPAEKGKEKKYGIVLAPPEHIRSNLPSVMGQQTISGLRMPHSLRALMNQLYPLYSGVLDLGIRFRVAKKMLDAVLLMHASGWVHKNIRSEIIIFFPEANGDGTGPTSKKPQPLDFTEPLFVGFNNAREDDVFDRARLNPFKTLDARNITLDYYQHPAKLRDRNLVYERFHDLYSLGVVLLEVGMWQTLDRAIPGIEGLEPKDALYRMEKLAIRLDGHVSSEPHG